MTRLFTRLYGAHPLHSLLLCGSFAGIAYCAVLASGSDRFVRMLVWFATAVLLHDAVLLPLYALADRVLTTRVLTTRGRRPALVNHIRVPVLASGLLFLLFLPGIIRQGAATYLAATGQDQGPFLGRWLVLSGLFALASALLYALRMVMGRLKGSADRET